MCYKISEKQLMSFEATLPNLSATIDKMNTEREFLIYWLMQAYNTLLRGGWEPGMTHEECSKALLNVLCNIGYRPDTEPALTLAKRKPNYIPPQ